MTGKDMGCIFAMKVLKKATIVRNQKDTIQSIVVREHLYRWRNWEMTERNLAFKKIDANTIEWKVDIAPEGEKTIRYTVRYTW